MSVIPYTAVNYNFIGKFLLVHQAVNVQQIILSAYETLVMP